MPQTDLNAVIAIHIGVFLLAFIAIASDFRAFIRAKKGMVQARVIRGESSMSALYTVYGASLATCLFLIEAATAAEGNRVILIASDFAIITYLFFFSSWFRNSVFFPFKRKVTTD